MKYEKEIRESCWVCNHKMSRRHDDPHRATREHLKKKSDLSGSPMRIFVRKYKPDGSLIHPYGKRVTNMNNSHLKHGYTICKKCNGHLTQPYDFAYENLSEYLKTLDTKKIDYRLVKTDKVFINSHQKEIRNNPQLGMEYVHLFFTKLFGCWIADEYEYLEELNFDLQPIGNAIVNSCPHPDIYLKFIHLDLPKEIDNQINNGSGLYGIWHQFENHTDEKPMFVARYYYMKKILIKIMFANLAMRRGVRCMETLGNNIIFESDDMLNAWHPRDGQNFYVVPQLWIR